MADSRGVAVQAGDAGLLERAANYLLGSLHLVTSEALTRATPCPEWDLRALFEHLDDSLLALHEATITGTVGLDEPSRRGGPAGDLVTGVRDRTRQLIGAWSSCAGQATVGVGGLPLDAAIVASAGAVEVAVHGWDVAQACGRHRAIPPALAAELVRVAPLLVSEMDRPDRFAASVRLPPRACSSDRLVAFLGRDPHFALANRAASWLCRTP